MNKLLDSLRELDPTTWRKLEEIKTTIRDAEEGWRVDGVEYYFGADIFPMIVQGVIQDAIEKHIWRWDLHANIYNSYDAYIWYRDRRGYEHDLAMPLETGVAPYERRNSPQEALLSAYVAALEAQE